MISKGSAKVKKNSKPFPYKVIDVDKENIPSSSHQVVIIDKKKQEEEQILEYMKIKYNTHGENLLNKFRSDHSIRTALGQIDDNDKLRAVEMQQVLNNANKKADIDGTTVQNTTLASNGVTAPMETSEVVEPQPSQSSH